jgi:antibiotic biosynthesis monooxygenase (ABM) superfamily enzyme
VTKWKTTLGVILGLFPIVLSACWRATALVPEIRIPLIDVLLWAVVSLPTSLLAPQFLPGAGKLLFVAVLWACVGIAIGHLVDRRAHRRISDATSGG